MAALPIKTAVILMALIVPMTIALIRLAACRTYAQIGVRASGATVQKSGLSTEAALP